MPSFPSHSALRGFMLSFVEVGSSNPQECIADREQQYKAENAEACLPGQSVEQLIQRGPHNAGELSDNIHKAVILSAALRRNQPAEIAAAQSLNATLHRSHQSRQYPEEHLTDAHRPFPGKAQSVVEIHNESHQEADNRYKGIQQNREGNKIQSALLLRQISEKDTAGHGNQLGNHQSQNHSDASQPQGIPILCRHVNNGIHPVNIEEIAQQEEKHRFVLHDASKHGPGIFPRSLSQLRGRSLHIAGLVHIFHKRYRENQPPYRHYQNRDAHAELALIHHQHNSDGNQEGNRGATDISHGVAPCADPVHALRCGYIRKEAVVKQVAAGETYTADILNLKKIWKATPIPTVLSYDLYLHILVSGNYSSPLKWLDKSSCLIHIAID